MSHTIGKHHGAELYRLHEVNYLLVTQLIPDLPGIDETASSRIDGVPDLHLRVLEHTPYTSVIVLTHHVPVGETHVAAPDLWLRIYHDAKVTEVIAHNDGEGPAHARSHTRYHELGRDIKWQLNRYAARWMEDCLALGHVLLPTPEDEQVFSCQGCY
ncbi:MAG: DUF1249 domain-containing protein [Granulosicoccaceae bacterium]|jgi:hypothetical protein